MKFSRITRQKIVMASGAMNLLPPWIGILHHPFDPVEHDLGERLQLARHAAGGAARREQTAPG